MRMINGVPAIVLRFGADRGRDALYAVLAIDADPSGRIRTVYNILATKKLRSIRFT
jgi:hypothetical protein